MANYFFCFPLFLILGGQVQDDIEQQSPTLENISDFHRISERLSSSGQVSPDEATLLKERGFEIVINLAPADENRNGFESFALVQLGLTYIHIPVSWENPSVRDLKLFFDVMDAAQDRKVFVHCFANKRASAFIYLYRILREKTSPEVALLDLEKVWNPDEAPQWSAFIGEVVESGIR